MDSKTKILQKALDMCDLGNFSESIRLAEKLIYHFNSPTGFYVLGLVYTIQENWFLAKKYCYETYKIAPTAYDNLNRLGVSLCHLGEIKEGLKFLKMGKDMGDYYCQENYKYWVNKL